MRKSEKAVGSSRGGNCDVLGTLGRESVPPGSQGESEETRVVMAQGTGLSPAEAFLGPRSTAPQGSGRAWVWEAHRGLFQPRQADVLSRVTVSRLLGTQEALQRVFRQS